MEMTESAVQKKAQFKHFFYIKILIEINSHFYNENVN